MRARVTNKIVLGDGDVILKHTPCTVIGWELHPRDRLQGTHAERHLSRMPSCIFLKFEDVVWTIDERLGRGVYPMLPTKVKWILNAKTEAKIDRTGYSLLPDFAWTAFMAQGMTLKALSADCGDVLDVPGLSEQTEIYTILSRLKTKEGLLLLRAFSHELFALGDTPGPVCMLKFLRARFEQQHEAYTVADAREEYKRR